MRRTIAVTAVAMSIFLGFPMLASSGMIVVKNEKNEYGTGGYAYVYNSESSVRACMQEIREIGNRGPQCDGLSFPVKAGTHVHAPGIPSSDYRYVIIKDGPKAGKSGFVSMNCYVDVEE